MCGSMAQSETRRCYARLLRQDILEREWTGEDVIPNTTLALAVLLYCFTCLAENFNQNTSPGATDRPMRLPQAEALDQCKDRQGLTGRYSTTCSGKDG